MTPFIARSLYHPVVHLVGTVDVDLVVPVLVGQTSFVTTLVWSLPVSGDKMYCEVERRGSPTFPLDIPPRTFPPPFSACLGHPPSTDVFGNLFRSIMLK